MLRVPLSNEQKQLDEHLSYVVQQQKWDVFPFYKDIYTEGRESLCPLLKSTR